MRYILATCFACAIGTPAALAAPGASISRDLATPGVTSEAALVQKHTVAKPAKHKSQRAINKSRKFLATEALAVSILWSEAETTEIDASIPELWARTSIEAIGDFPATDRRSYAAR